MAGVGRDGGTRNAYESVGFGGGWSRSSERFSRGHKFLNVASTEP